MPRRSPSRRARGKTLTLQSFFRILWLQRWVIVGSIVLVVLGAVAYQQTITPFYTSSIVVNVNPALTADNSASGLPTFALDPGIIEDPAVKAAAAQTLGANPDQMGTVVASVGTTGVVVTTTAASPGDAQALANAYGPAVESAINARVPDYLAELDTSLQEIVEQIEQVSGQTVNELLQQAQASVIIEQYKAAFSQQAAAKAAGASAVSISAQAGPGVLATLSLRLTVQVAILAGLFVGVGLALLRNWLDGRIVAPVDVQNAVDAPVVGLLPADKGLARVGRPTIDSQAQSPGLVEDVRRMRTAVGGMLDRGGSVVLVTGVRRGDGASFVAANLAAANARAGQMAVAVSGDVRDPGLTDYFGIVDDRPGPLGNRSGRTVRRARRAEPRTDDQVDGRSTTVASPVAWGSEEPSGRARPGMRPSPMRVRQPTADSPAEVMPNQEYQPTIRSLNGSTRELRLRQTAVEGLSLLISLVGPGQDADALAGDRVRTFLEGARSRSDLVVMDSPPIFDYADPVVLAGYADLVVVVVRSGRTRRKELTAAVGLLRDANVDSVAVVVNQVRRWRSRRSGTALTPDRSRSLRERQRNADI